MKTNLTLKAAELVSLMPALMQDTANAETTVIALLKPVFDERDEALRHLSPDCQLTKQSTINS